jgi:hypothetical protein
MTYIESVADYNLKLKCQISDTLVFPVRLQFIFTSIFHFLYLHQGRGVHVTGVSAAYTFKLNKNILSE